MKSLVLLFSIFLLSTINAKAQEWYKVSYVFNFKNISNERQFSKYDFEIKEGSRTDHYELDFDDVNDYLILSYYTMGGSQPVFIITKKNQKMIIDLDEYYDNSNVDYNFNKKIYQIIIPSKFKKGIFKVVDKKLEPIFEIDWRINNERKNIIKLTQKQ